MSNDARRRKRRRKKNKEAGTFGKSKVEKQAIVKRKGVNKADGNQQQYSHGQNTQSREG
jgi:hypothetical protein